MISAALTPRCSISGADELGRWSWIKLESDKPIYMVSVYCPCTSSEVGSTFQQHCRQLPPSTNPRDSFLTDLVKSIKEWHTQGASCIIGGDFNHDIRGRKIREFLEKAELYNPIELEHGPMPFATQQRNFSGTAINAIFCSRHLRPYQSGYASHDQAIHSDHVAVWMDFEWTSLFPPKPTDNPAIDQLNVGDP